MRGPNAIEVYDSKGRDQYSTRSYSAKDLEKMGNEVSLE